MINLYNANAETEQVFVLNNLSSLLENFDVMLEKNLILAGDFNLFLNSKLDAKEGKPVIKKKSFAKLIQLKSSHEYFHLQTKSIVQCLFNVDLTIFLFLIVFKNL